MGLREKNFSTLPYQNQPLMKTHLLFLTFLFGLRLMSQTPLFLEDDIRPRGLQIDQTYLHANLSFIPEKGKIMGDVLLDFVNKTENLDSLWLDGINMKMTTVTTGDSNLYFTVHPKGIAVFFSEPLALDSSLTLSYSYTAEPKRGMYFLGWNDEIDSRKQIWTQGQGIDNRHWLPHVDAQNDKLITALTVRFAKGYEVISNGELTKKSEQELEVWHYKMTEPQSSYLMMLAIGEYKSFTEHSENNVELTNYYYPEWENRNEFTYAHSTDIFNYLESEIGVPYPWQNYKQVPVKNFQHGAMENTTATIFADFYCVDEISFKDDNYIGVNAHELAHQWFGNWVTALTSHDHWLHEGFATYYSWLAEKEVVSKEVYHQRKFDALQHIIEAENLDNYPLQHSKTGSVRFYEKGAWVLDMLRTEMGDSAYRDAIVNYLNQNAHGLVTTNKFKDACENAANKDLSTFFEQWVYRPDLPKMVFNAEWIAESEELKMRFEQLQKINIRQPAFQFTLPVTIKTNQETYTYTLNFTSQTKTLNLFLNRGEKVEYIEVDPDFTQLINWSYELPEKWMYRQIQYGESKTVSALYLQSLGQLNFDNKTVEEIDVENWPEFAQEEWIKAAIANIDEADKKWMLEQLEKVGRDGKLAFLYNAETIPDAYEKEIITWLEYPSYELQAEALLKLSLSFRKNIDKYLKITENTYGTRGNNVRIYWLMLHRLKGDTHHTQEWVDFTGSRYDFLTRMNALQAFAVFDHYLDEAMLPNLFQGLFQGNRRLRSEAKNYLKICYQDPTKQKAILAFIESSKTEWPDWQKIRVEKTFEIKL